jgi:hypothetical protein
MKFLSCVDTLKLQVSTFEKQSLQCSVGLLFDNTDTLEIV